MKPLFPDVADGLRAAADARATGRLDASADASRDQTTASPDGAAHVAPPTDHEPRGPRRRTRRPGWRTGLIALTGGLLISTGAYAARGLWQPELGSEGQRPVAIAGPPSTKLVDRFGVLRREQTEADRGAASQQALKFPGSDEEGVRTDFVRRLEPAGSEDAVVLVPIAMGDGTERLCVWVGPRDARAGVGGARACGTARELLQGRLSIGIGESPKPDDADEAELASLRRQQSAILGPDRGSSDRDGLTQAQKDELTRLDEEMRVVSTRSLADHTLRVVGVVPDGVAKVRIGKPARIIDVRDNVFSLVALESEVGGSLSGTMLGADGKQVPWTTLGVPDPYTTGPQGEITPEMRERLSVQLATNIDPVFAEDFARFESRIRDSCLQLLHDPPLSEAHQVHHVQRQFQKDIDGFDDADASLLLEVLRGTWCPIDG